MLWLYIYFSLLLGCCSFFCGFFPTYTSSRKVSTIHNLPTFQRNVYYRHFNKIVIVIIDALRYDFVDSDVSEEFFPFTKSLLEKEDSCLFKAFAHPPTVTLPRIKALVSGVVPSFTDVILNFGKEVLTIDNFIDQSKQNGLKTVFYGDETWLSLFPNSFLRSEGTSSFFINDYIEVDDNVTRNVEKELYRDDWDIMILHYLGLDHIGHLEGPRSNLVKPKLLEMDNIISKLYNNTILSSNKSNIIIICGDHGMKDSGGHGGTSLPEVLTPFIILNYNCEKSLKKKEIKQIDVAPLLSIFMGLPIPADSIGIVEENMLSGLKKTEALYAMAYNVIRMFELFRANVNDDSYIHTIIELIDKGMDSYRKLYNNSNFNDDYLECINIFQKAQKEMSEYLIRVNLHIDFNFIFLGIVIFIQILLGSLFYNLKIIHTQNLLYVFFVICCVTFINIFYPNTLFSSDPFKFSLFLVGCTSAAINFLLIEHCWHELPSFSRTQKLFLIIFVLYLFSLTSSSFVEEEHQFWYFMYVTIVLCCPDVDLLNKIILLLSHRFLRYLNQTGDKWAFLPDISDWLLKSENSNYLTGIFIFGLISMIFHNACLYKSNFPLKLLSLCQYSTILLYKISNENIKFNLLNYNSSNGIFEAHCFWAFTFIKIILRIVSFKRASKNYKNINLVLCEILYETMLSIICLLYKPYNIIILLSLIFTQKIIFKTYKNDLFALIYLSYFLGMLCYFYQGNSNSISSADVSVGYVGLTQFNIFSVSFLIIINTFACPIMSFISLLKFLAERGQFRKNWLIVLRVHILCHSFEVFIYSLLMLWQRHHLFVWSVFSPKFLYLICHVILNFILNTIAAFISALENY